MATRSCPTCGTQYVATVRRCIDCDASLVDEAAPTAKSERAETARSSTEIQDQDQGRELAYALEGWGNQLKVTLEGMLDRAGIARVWEAGTLVFPTVHQAAVDRLIATLEGGDLVEPDDDLPRVALEIEGLDADRQADLDAKLIASGLAYAWDDQGDLVILEDDEDAVLVIIDDVLADDTDDDDDDPLASQAALSDLFVAVDRLMKKPGDPTLARPVTVAVAHLARRPVPYGFSASDFEELVAQGQDLVRLIDPTHGLNPVSDVVPSDGSEPPEPIEAPPDDEVTEELLAESNELDQEFDEQVAILTRELRDRLAELV